MDHYALTASSPLSVIVPTLNEQNNVKKLVERIHNALHNERITYEIVFIDDHSTDNTIKNLELLSTIYPELRIYKKEGKRGKAFSLLQGFDEAKYNLVCMIDADLQYPPEAIVPMYRKLQKESADIVVTERVEQETSFLRQLSTRMFNLVFTRLLFGIDLDSQSGLKLFKKRILRTISISPSQWSFDLEFIIRSLEQNYKISNHKIAFSERTEGKGKVNMFTTTYELIKASVHLRLTTSRKKVRQVYES